MVGEISNNKSKVNGMISYIDPKSFEIDDNIINQKDDELNEKSDVYSVGVLMWQISSGRKPFSLKGSKDTNDDYNNDISLALAILDGKREEVIDETPDVYRNLYQGN